MTDKTHGGAGPDRSVLEDIEKNGVQLFFDEDEESGSSRAFTLGLWHLRQRPEVVALGLPEDLAVQVLELVPELSESSVPLSSCFQVGPFSLSMNSCHAVPSH